MTRLLVLLTPLVLFSVVLARADSASSWSSDPCTPESMGTTLGVVSSIYRITDGEIDGRCYGPVDDDLFRAWQALDAITEPADRQALAGFAIYDGRFAGFAQQLDADASSFAIAIERDATRAHPDSLRYVVAHEFAHVLTSHHSNVWSGNEVATVGCLEAENRYGCVGWGNYLATWTHQFWPESEIDQLEVAYRSSTEAARRCVSDGRFVSEYAATNPGEDFAETFAAFVLGVPVDGAAVTKVQFMASYPDIVALRDRIAARGLTTPNLRLAAC